MSLVDEDLAEEILSEEEPIVENLQDEAWESRDTIIVDDGNMPPPPR